jgi:predicted TIM-barrel fold metal-dependent hydrolase
LLCNIHRLIDLIGPDRALFATDYPHAESSLGFEQDTIRAVFDATSSIEDAQNILGGNAIKLFKMQ